MKSIYVYSFLTILLFGTACSGSDKKGATEEKVGHPKLIKTIGSPRYGNVQCILQDKAGNLWFGTTENGLYKYDGKTFKRFLVADGLISNNVYCLLEDKEGKIWIGSSSGLCVYDSRVNAGVGRAKMFSQIHIPLPKNLPPNKSDLYRNSQWVFSIIQAKSGKLWFATINGVYIYDGEPRPGDSASFTPFLFPEAVGGFANSNNNMERMLEDNAGNIWFGGRGHGGVFRYDGKTVTKIQLKELFTSVSDSIRKAHDWAWPQLQDKNGNIWFTNWGGVYRYDGKVFTTLTKKDGLAGDMVAQITEDKKGNLWFGGDGLARYDGKSFTRFTTKDGLPNFGVWSILEDVDGNVWVGTRETGLYMFDGKSFSTYSEYKQQPATDSLTR